MLRDLIVQSVTSIGLTLSDEVVDALVAHAQSLLEENRAHNLTRLTSPADVACLHVADSLVALPYVAEAPSGEMADLGSGGGYPGIPLALASKRPALLVESRSKKAAYLERVSAALPARIRVACARAEELPEDERGRFGVVTARALASLPVLVELASPLLVAGGLLVALKGDPEEGEIVAGDDAAAIVGMRRAACEGVALPCAEVRRTILVFEKAGESSIRLPRRAGMAQKRPLA